MAAAGEETQRRTLLQLQYPGGMSRAISWSKNGFICYALTAKESPYNLYMTYLENVDGQNWQLARPQGLTVKPLDSSAVPDLHLVQWSNLLTDLAVFDSQGNFYILLAGVGLLRGKKSELNGTHVNGNGAVNGKTAENGKDDDSPSYELTSYNHTEMIYRDILAPNNASVVHGRCVAFKWLGMEKPQIINKPALLAEDGQSYVYGVQLYQPPVLAHPIATKQACVALRQNGFLNLYYQGEHKVEYHKLSINLAANNVEGSMYITHGSIGFPSDKKIIVCAYDAMSDKIVTYSVSVDWGFLVESATRQKTDPHYQTAKEARTPPTVTAAILNEMRPASLATGEVVADQKNQIIQNSRMVLIEIIPPYYALNTALDILIAYELTSTIGERSTMIQRFHLKDAADTLDDIFSTIPGAEDPQKGQLYSLVLKDKFHAPKLLQSIKTAVSDSLILIVYEDGSIDPLNRLTWTTISSGSPIKEEAMDIVQENPKTLNSILDCGFSFPAVENSETPFMMAISPNVTSIVYAPLGNDDPLSLSVLQRNSPTPDSNLMAIAFAFTHAHSCYANTCSDDLIALIKAEVEKLESPEARQTLAEQIIKESHRTINFHLNSFGKESVDKLLSNPPLQKLLSLQLVLGDLCKKKLMSDIAWVVLNLRSTSFGIMFSLSSIYRQLSKKKPTEDTLEDSINRAECVMLLVGNVKWFIDLVVYLNQELLQLSTTKNNPDDSLVTIHNSVALPIILSKVPRLFLMYALSSIGKTHEILKKLYKDLSESNKLYTPMKDALNRFFNACNLSPLNLSIFENFLRECESYVAKELSNKIANDRMQPLQIEQQLFCQGFVSDDMIPIAKVLIDRHNASISRDLKLSELYFYENSWIDVGIETPTFTSNAVRKDKFKPTIPRLQYSQTAAIDALRKIIMASDSPIASGGASQMGRGYVSTNKIRKCVRCRSVSLVADPLIFNSLNTVGLWTMVFQRTCICGSAWINCG